MKKYKKAFLGIILLLASVWVVFMIDFVHTGNGNASRSRESRVIVPMEPHQYLRKLGGNKSTHSDDTFRHLLENISSHSESLNYKSVVITIVDKQYHDIMENFYMFIKRLKLTNVLAVCLDKTTHQRLQNIGVTSIYDPSVENTTKSYTTFLSDEFKLKSAMKIKYLVRALKLGFGVVMTDADVIFLKNPFDYFRCYDCDLEMSDNLPPHRNASLESESDTMCIGFFYARPTSKTIWFVSQVQESLRLDPLLWDQVEFNRLARKAVDDGQLVVNILDYELFPSGGPFFFDHYLVPNPYTKAVVYHVNWMNNVVEKTYRAREMGLWLPDHNGYYSDENAKYMTYGNPLPELRYMELRVLITAMKLAKALGRILIIPKFTCPPLSKKNGWKIDCRYRPVGECFCSLTEIVNLKHTPILDYHPWREHVFLSHASVPSKIKESVSELLMVSNELTRKYPGLHTGVYLTYHPKDTIRGASKEEMINWLKEYNHVSVLRFRALYGNFWI